MSKALDKRLSNLEQTGGAAALGIVRQGDDFVTVTGSGERMTPAEFEAKYPAGTIIEIVYTNDWQQGGSG